MEGSELLICPGREALAQKAVERIRACADNAFQQRGRFLFVLAGGSTPEQIYSRLAQSGNGRGIDWSNTLVFFGDERFVPPDDPRSNFAMAQRTLLGRAAIPSAHVFPVPTERGNAAEAAKAYADQLVRFFATDSREAPPRFDLVLLGLGEDGHAASLFPHAAALDVADAWVTWSGPGSLPPAVERVTLTYPVFNAARQIVFLVSGENKATALRDVLEGNADLHDRPAAGIRPTDGTILWLVDESAAGLLRKRS